ncbi:MAG TPA: 3-phosphoshikimate 1-carboxyvinyltransferase [candidate division Zixibacteria bacterium]|nr:3-phosphoshikimate 1-carboxyvinyltransferase [candidate division Zixibacteria bacterium]
MRLVVSPQKKPLIGSISVPGDKSISHRAIMLAALADGESTIRNWLPAGDTLATLGALQRMGVEIEVVSKTMGSWDLIVHGGGMSGLKQPDSSIDCRNAGTCMRLLSGIAAGQSFPLTLDGSEQLRRRPMSRITNPLRKMGAKIVDNDGQAPLSFNPAKLEGIDYHMPIASAQVKSALLLAALYAHGRTNVVEPGPTRDHTERMLQAMGVKLEIDEAERGLDGPIQKLLPLDLVVPGDFSSAAFLLVASTVVPHSEVTIKGVGINKTRSGLADILAQMGARIDQFDTTMQGGEPTANLTARSEELESIHISGDTVVRAIDEFPIWAVAATQAFGRSVLSDAAELRVKEVDRIALLAAEISRMGAMIEEETDGLAITGPTRLQGAEVDSHGDHRLGMALAIAGLAASSPTVINNAGCIFDSFPLFVETMQAVRADLQWRD